MNTEVIGTLSHRDGMSWSSTERRNMIAYRKAEVAIEVPRRGRVKQSVRCPFCYESVELDVCSGRRNAFFTLLTAPLWLALFAGLGWALIAADISKSLLWLPRLLLFGISPFIVGNIVYALFFGADPTAEQTGSTISHGGNHSYWLPPQKRSLRIWWIVIGVVELIGLGVGYATSGVLQ